MDGRVSKSLLRLEDLPYYGSFTKSIYAGKGVIFVLGNNSTRHKFNIGEGRGEETKAYLLYKQSVEGSGRSIPTNREVGFALITTSRKLRHYFQAHVINVLIDHPLKKAMNKLEAVGRLIQ